QPVKGAVHVASSNRFVKSGDDVVMLFTALVVLSEAPLEHFGDELGGNLVAAPRQRRNGVAPYRVRRVQRPSRVAVGVSCKQLERVFAYAHRSAVILGEAGDGLGDDAADVLGGERLEHEYAQP